MKSFLKATLTIAAMAVASQTFAQVSFFQDDNYQGASFTTE